MRTQDSASRLRLKIAYREHWARKTVRQIEKEISSWHAHMDKHSAAYAWQGRDMTPPGDLADGDKLLILREILKERSRCNG